MDTTPEEVSAELSRVMGSRAFARSQRARELLDYLVNNRPDRARLKESAIALDVFGRDAATYDSATDGIVRVAVNRLRELLDRYYDDEGRANALRFDIQRGGYTVVVRRTTPSGLPSQPRIAVLPLANFTGSTDEDALCDGLTEEIIDAMTRLPDVRIIARTSSFRFKNTSQDVRQIASELAVEALLEGSVQLDGNQLKVTAQLIFGGDGTHLWSHVFTFPRSERQVLLDALIDIMLRSLQVDRVANALPLPARPLQPQVQSLIDQARGLNVTQAPENLALAEAIARRATELDPLHADAWFVLAMVRYSRRSVLTEASSGASDECEAALERALQLDPGNAQARSLSAYTTICGQHRWDEGLLRAREAVAIAPNHAGINARLGFVYLSLRRFSEAIATYEHVTELDPLAPPGRFHHALALMCGGKLDEARRAIETARHLLGESALYYDMLCTWHELAGESFELARVAEQGMRRHPSAGAPVYHAAHALAAGGELAAARALCAKLTHLRPGAYRFACAYAESGGPDSDAFFDHAAAVATPPESLQLLLPCQPAFRARYGDARWHALLRQMNHPAATVGAAAEVAPTSANR